MYDGNLDWSATDDGTGYGDEYIEDENTSSGDDSDSTEYADSDSEDTSGTDYDEVVERLDSLVTTLNTSRNLEQYYNQTLGFYVFPDYDTLILYFPPEDGNVDDWIQASDNYFVPVAHLEEYEAYLLSFEETEETTETGMNDFALLEDIDKTLHEQQDKLDIITSTVSGNGVITVSLDETTTQMLSQMHDEQTAIKEELTGINSTILLVFFVLVFDLLHRFAKRIIKNMMRGGNDNE